VASLGLRCAMAIRFICLSLHLWPFAIGAFIMGAVAVQAMP